MSNLLDTNAPIRSRIKEFRNVPASQLKANKSNWRTHPQAQFDSLKTMLKEIGYVGAVIARELPDKTLQIIDGHLRTGISEMGGKDELVPTLIVDLTEKEAKKILATYDPISAMAETDTEALGKLLKQITLPSDLVEKIWDKKELEVIMQTAQSVEFKEYNESVADGIVVCKCSTCGHEHAKKN